MHWFWRATIAISVGGGFLAFVTWWIFTFPSVKYQADYIWVFSGCVVVPVLTVAVYRRLSLWNGDYLESRETRCRKCDYILRGITEPRCPECGETI